MYVCVYAYVSRTCTRTAALAEWHTPPIHQTPCYLGIFTRCLYCVIVFHFTISISVVTVTGTATAVFICHHTSTATEVEIGASDGVAGQCITFITRVVNG